ncbi:Uncharacterized protein PRO82_001655 [Candidatus Protochlamydia amoebophila]|uniref:hypothetical protein n=1 Tax=Candidatus Protochlamydia amoebophila TaxID=362787 RepID=UPI001BC93271|nr:hypothetical protein [Candidatus Protochlamydia amoebophila]MBS4164333.1 Uncharacterized protein [Candidatus Protochlamydia amoebophila]
MLKALPQLSTLPISLTIDTLTGFIYGKLFHVNAELTATIFGVYCLADKLLFHSINTLMRNQDNLRSHHIYILTHSLCFPTLTLVLSRLNLIGKKGNFLMSSIGLLHIGKHCWQIYKNSPELRRQIQRLQQLIKF